jgi:hypothetical protein
VVSIVMSIFKRKVGDGAIGSIGAGDGSAVGKELGSIDVLGWLLMVGERLIAGKGGSGTGSNVTEGLADGSGDGGSLCGIGIMTLGLVDGRKLGCTVGPSTCRLVGCGVSNGEAEGLVVWGSCIGTAVSDTTGETGGCIVWGSCIGTAVSDTTGETGGSIVWGSCIGTAVSENTGETGGCVVWGSSVSLCAVGRYVGNSTGKTEGSALWGTIGLFVGGLVGVNDKREVAIVCAVVGTVVGLLRGKMLGCLDEKV